MKSTKALRSSFSAGFKPVAALVRTILSARVRGRVDVTGGFKVECCTSAGPSAGNCELRRTPCQGFRLFLLRAGFLRQSDAGVNLSLSAAGTIQTLPNAAGWRLMHAQGPQREPGPLTFPQPLHAGNVLAECVDKVFLRHDTTLAPRDCFRGQGAVRLSGPLPTGHSERGQKGARNSQTQSGGFPLGGFGGAAVLCLAGAPPSGKLAPFSNLGRT